MHEIDCHFDFQMVPLLALGGRPRVPNTGPSIHYTRGSDSGLSALIYALSWTSQATENQGQLMAVHWYQVHGHILRSITNEGKRWKHTQPKVMFLSGLSRISQRGAPTPEAGVCQTFISQIFCLPKTPGKWKKLEKEEARIPSNPPPPLIRHCSGFNKIIDLRQKCNRS